MTYVREFNYREMNSELMVPEIMNLVSKIHELLEELVSKKAEPMNRDEEEIAGYREVLNAIHENYDYITLRSKVILQLHRDLYSFDPSTNGGRYKIN